MAKSGHSGVSMAATFLPCQSAFSFPSVVFEGVPLWPQQWVTAVWVTSSSFCKNVEIRSAFVMWHPLVMRNPLSIQIAACECKMW